jgi:hypothetical protein
MPSISSCPACHRDLTIPDLDPRQQSLRCPLCDAEFPAEQVLADCVPFPPMAIIVEARPPRVESSDDAADKARQYSTADAARTATPEFAALTAASPVAHESEEIKDVSPHVSETSSSNAIEEQPAVTNDAAEEAAKGSAADYEAFGQQVASMRVAPRARRQTSALGMLGQLLGMALGGVLGLAIGYYVLVWIGGAQADFLELRGKLPRWLVPPARRHQVPSGPMPLMDHTDSDDEAKNALAELLGQSETLPAVVALPDSLPDAGDVLQPDLFPTNAEQSQIAADRVEQELADRFGTVPKALPKGYRGPRGFKLRTAAELKVAIEESDLALRCPHCQMPGAVRLVGFDSAADASGQGASVRRCEYCRGKPVLNINTAGFEQLCDLAEAVTYVQLGGDDAGRQQLREAAETILLAIGSQRDKREMVGRLAGARMDDGGRQTNGIVLAGTVQSTRTEGEFFALQIMLLGCGKTVTLISRQPPEPPLARRDHVVVLGSIIDSPSENLVGYSGDAAQVIWGGLHLKLVE